ncbi:MAG TPA: hypothetical protein VKY31_01455 [Terriglobia bacterium]|jgi:hypothetical protein|nr:hypothetical protein [Terriglobia bacterium]HZP34182.1 hypothetical protein [Candidatus Acidoferrales bacterium]
MTVDDLEPLFDHWKDNPPTHLILGAVYLKKRKSPAHTGVTEQELLAAGVMKINPKPKHG